MSCHQVDYESDEWEEVGVVPKKQHLPIAVPVSSGPEILSSNVGTSSVCMSNVANPLSIGLLHRLKRQPKVVDAAKATRPLKSSVGVSRNLDNVNPVSKLKTKSISKPYNRFCCWKPDPIDTRHAVINNLDKFICRPPPPVDSELSCLCKVGNRAILTCQFSSGVSLPNNSLIGAFEVQRDRASKEYASFVLLPLLRSKTTVFLRIDGLVYVSGACTFCCWLGLQESHSLLVNAYGGHTNEPCPLPFLSELRISEKLDGSYPRLKDVSLLPNSIRFDPKEEAWCYEGSPSILFSDDFYRFLKIPKEWQHATACLNCCKVSLTSDSETLSLTFLFRSPELGKSSGGLYTTCDFLKHCSSTLLRVKNDLSGASTSFDNLLKLSSRCTTFETFTDVPFHFRDCVVQTLPWDTSIRSLRGFRRLFSTLRYELSASRSSGISNPAEDHDFPVLRPTSSMLAKAVAFFRSKIVGNARSEFHQMMLSQRASSPFDAFETIARSLLSEATVAKKLTSKAKEDVFTSLSQLNSSDIMSLRSNGFPCTVFARRKRSPLHALSCLALAMFWARGVYDEDNRVCLHSLDEMNQLFRFWSLAAAIFVQSDEKVPPFYPWILRSDPIRPTFWSSSNVSRFASTILSAIRFEDETAYILWFSGVFQFAVFGRESFLSSKESQLTCFRTRSLRTWSKAVLSVIDVPKDEGLPSPERLLRWLRHDSTCFFFRFGIAAGITLLRYFSAHEIKVPEGISMAPIPPVLSCIVSCALSTFSLRSFVSLLSGASVASCRVFFFMRVLHPQLPVASRIALSMMLDDALIKEASDGTFKFGTRPHDMRCTDMDGLVSECRKFCI